MNIFSRFFGVKSENKRTEQVASDEKFPNFNYELEFLQALNKSPTSKLFGLNSYWEDRYKELLGDLKPIIKGFLSNGYLVESLKEESLSLKELKFILQKNGLSTTGNKEVLAQRISENVADKSYLRNLDSFFKLTEKGKEEIKSYREKFDIEYSDFLSCQADLFEKGEIQRFISNHFKVKSAFPDQRSIGLGSDSLSEKTKNILRHLSGKKDLRLLSGLPKDMELKVRSVIAILDLNSSLHLPFAEEYLKDLDVLILKDLSARYFGKDFVNDENISLSNCLFFEYNTLWNHYALEELKGIPNSRILKNKFFGVQILNEGCFCNEKFGVEKYPWGELDNLPLLPRHLGCKCIFNPFSEE
jgi:hypothetical protein